MMQHTNIIPVRIGCQAMADGISPLSPKISNQTELAQAICQISVTNGQNITKAAVQVMDHRTSVVDNAPMSQLKHSNQKPEIPIDKTSGKSKPKFPRFPPLDVSRRQRRMITSAEKSRKGIRKHT
ncbi:hypothetical protein, partial [Lentilitoribacter sp. EG35]|uniref:hypothetical protein n=1 Tax=Lentilitoribacter sp. EG35 TaxID=3234192 RepID=UPI0034614D38